ncbi:hypothetical protein AAFF27_03725 [Xylophilus sp. GW821-FHT01B05]
MPWLLLALCLAPMASQAALDVSTSDKVEIITTRRPAPTTPPPTSNPTPAARPPTEPPPSKPPTDLVREEIADTRDRLTRNLRLYDEARRQSATSTATDTLARDVRADLERLDLLLRSQQP